MMNRVIVALLSLAAASLAASSFAQGYPSKPVRLLLTFSSGGQADILARAVTEKVAASFEQPFVIDARPGAGGNLAMEAVAKAAPDGYTLVFGTPAVAINGTLYPKLTFDPLRDLVPITLAAWGPYALYVSAALPVSSVSELIAYARARPGQVNYASVGVGSGTHLVGVLFSLAAGTEMTHVPYKGIQQAAPDLVAGQVHLTFNAIGPLAGFLQTGKIKLLAGTSLTRLPRYPDVPTIAESGLPGFDAAGWYGFFAPARTPRDILVRVNTEIVRALNTRDLAERIELGGLQPAPQSLEEAERFVQREAEKWSKAVRASGARAE